MTLNHSKDYQNILDEVLSKEQDTRLKAISKVRDLPENLSQDILLRGLSHWDLQLRKASAKELDKLLRERAVPYIIKAYKQRLLHTKIVVELLSKYSNDNITKLFNDIYQNERLQYDLEKILEHLTCIDEAGKTYIKLRLSKEINKAIRQGLKTQKSYDLKSFVSIQTLDWQIDFFANDTNLEYLRKRKFKAIILEFAKKLIKEKPFETALAEKILDELSDNQVISVLKYAYKNDGYLIYKLEEYIKKRNIDYNNIFDPIQTFVTITKTHEAKIKEKRVPLITEDRLKPLSELLNLSTKTLLVVYVQWEDMHYNYNTFEVPKKKGGFRVICSPNKYLKLIQRKIMTNILYKIDLHENCHGFRPEHSIVSNATPHVGKTYCINMDLESFFPTITPNRVFGLFSSLGYDSWTASFLTMLTTLDEELPQGAPTSPAISNIICRHLDKRLSVLAEKNKAVYTRYADDLTFSSDKDNRSLIPLIVKIIKEEGFDVAKNKLRITRKSNRQEVTGLVVNEKVTIPRHIRQKLRAVMYNLKQGKDIYWNGNKMTMQQFQGHLAYLRSVQPALGQAYLEELKKNSC